MMIIKEMVIKAIKEDCLDKMLVGQGSYKCEISEFVAAEVPTDWPNIIRSIYILYKEKPELLVNEKFEKAINQICSMGAFELYCAVMVVFFQIISEEKHSAPFCVNKEQILKNINNNLKIYKKELKSCYEWTGKRYSDGLWGDIMRVNNILYEDYRISIVE